MAADATVPSRTVACALACALFAAGCATPAPAPAPAPAPPAAVVIAPLPTPDTAAPRLPAEMAPPADGPAAESAAVHLVLAYADRVRAMQPPEVTAELARLATQEGTAGRLVQMALLLLHTRVPGDSLKAAQFLQRVQGQDSREARALQPLARQLATQALEQRRLEEVVDRQAQQLRDANRRADQLQDRLEALRAIERARPNRPTP